MSLELRAACKAFSAAIQIPAKLTMEDYCAYCLANDMVYAVSTIPPSYITENVVIQAIARCNIDTIQFINRKVGQFSALISWLVLKRGNSSITRIFLERNAISVIYLSYMATREDIPLESLECCIVNIRQYWMWYNSVDITNSILGVLAKGITDSSISKLHAIAAYGLLSRTSYDDWAQADVSGLDMIAVPGPDWMKIAKTNNFYLVKFAWEYRKNASFLDENAERRILQCPDVTSIKVRDFLRKRING